MRFAVYLAFYIAQIRYHMPQIALASCWMLIYFTFSFKSSYAQENIDSESAVAIIEEIDFTKPISLNHLLKCARQNNPAKKIAEAKLASGQADIFQAQWAHMPSIKNESGGVPLPQRRLMRYCVDPNGNKDANGFLNVAPCPDQGIQDDQRLSDTKGMGYFIRTQTTMTIPLITFGKISSGQEAANAGFKAYEYAVQSATRSFDAMVYQAYFGLQLTSQIARIFADGQKEISKFKEIMQKDIDQDNGKYSQNDLRKLLIREAEIAIKKTELDSIEEQTWGSIHILCKAPKLTQVQEIDKISPHHQYQSQYQLDQYELKAIKFSLKSEDVYFKKALENQPELKAAQWAVNARKAQVDMSEAQFMPNIALMSFLNFAKSNSAQDNPDPFANDPFNVFSWGAYLGIDWRFDFSRMIADVKRAKAVLWQSQAEQEALLQKSRMDLLERMTQIQKFEQVQKLRKDALKSAKQWFTSSALNTASGLGNSSADDLTRALAAYYEAAINHYQSISEYNIAIARLAVLLNISLDDLVAL